MKKFWKKIDWMSQNCNFWLGLLCGGALVAGGTLTIIIQRLMDAAT